MCLMLLYVLLLAYTPKILRPEGLEPDLITFSSLISACEADGEWIYAPFA